MTDPTTHLPHCTEPATRLLLAVLSLLERALLILVLAAHLLVPLAVFWSLRIELLAACVLSALALVVTGHLSVPFLVGAGRVRRWRRRLSVEAALKGHYPPQITVACFLNQEGFLARMAGEHERAERMYEHALWLLRGMGNDQVAGVVLLNLAQLARVRHRVESCRGLVEQASTLLGEGHLLLRTRVWVARQRGDLEALASLQARLASLPDEVDESDWREFYECDHWRYATSPVDPRLQLDRGFLVMDDPDLAP